MSKQKTYYDQQRTERFDWQYKLSHPIYKKYVIKISELITALTRKDEKILEIGCGLGLESNFIPRKNLLVSDISIKRCQSKKKRVQYNVDSKEETSKMKRKFGKFDLIYEIATLHHFNNMSQGISNLKNLSKCVVFIEPVVWNPQNFMLAMSNYKHEPHFLEMTIKNLQKLFKPHFSEVGHWQIKGDFHYLALLFPHGLAKKLEPLISLTTLPLSNVFVCRN